MSDYDVVIVGAGPAGSTTAYYASKAGASVLLLDKKKEIGYPVQCGEFIPAVDELREMMPEATDLDELFNLEEGLISKRTENIRIFSPGKKTYEIEFNGYTVERREFDKYLAEKAVKEGAELRTGTTITGFNGKKITSTDGEFKGKVIVGADGPLSRVGRWAGLQGPSKLSRCILCEVPGEFPPVVEMYFGSAAPGGYAWVIPKAHGANVGLGVQKWFKEPLNPLLQKFLRSRGLRMKPKFFSAGHVPVSGPVPRTVKGNVLIVGDAAGHVMATNGGGIPIAMICGRIAGNVIGEHLNGLAPLERYETEWRKMVGRELGIALRTKKLADLVFRWDGMLEMSMAMMGARRMSRAMKCKHLFGK